MSLVYLLQQLLVIFHILSLLFRKILELLQQLLIFFLVSLYLQPQVLLIHSHYRSLDRFRYTCLRILHLLTLPLPLQRHLRTKQPLMPHRTFPLSPKQSPLPHPLKRSRRHNWFWKLPLSLLDLCRHGTRSIRPKILFYLISCVVKHPYVSSRREHQLRTSNFLIKIKTKRCPTGYYLFSWSRLHVPRRGSRVRTLLIFPFRILLISSNKPDFSLPFLLSLPTHPPTTLDRCPPLAKILIRCHPPNHFLSYI